MITIPLSKTGRKHKGKYETIVDDCDADLAELNWSVEAKKRHNLTYAMRQKSGSRRLERLHRVILSRILGRALLKTEFVDHIDGNGLNNQHSNLRVATHSQNIMNSKKMITNTTGYKGVRKLKRNKGNVYRSFISINNNKIYLGTFNTPEEAHAAYCEAAKEYFGEFANDG